MSRIVKEQHWPGGYVIVREESWPPGGRRLYWVVTGPACGNTARPFSRLKDAVRFVSINAARESGVRAG